MIRNSNELAFVTRRLLDKTLQQYILQYPVQIVRRHLLSHILLGDMQVYVASNALI